MLYQSACSSGASTKSLTARNNLMDAQRVYRNALQMLLLVAGPSHPYSSCVSRKLLAVQSRLPAEAVALGPEVCNLCGGKEVPHYDSVTTLRAQQEGEIKALPRCGRCRNVAYCCPEHQRAQWRLHKAACRAPPAPPDETK
jgi:anthranilate/para-aminobenzoate synthase component II